MATITDGKTGRTVEVNANNRLMIVAEDIEMLYAQGARGSAFTFATGMLALTSSNESCVLYVKNTDPTQILIIDKLQYNIGRSVSGSGDVQIRSFKNPSGGTLLTSAVQALGGNRNFGSLVSPQAIVGVGGEGYTLTPSSTLQSALPYPTEFVTQFLVGLSLPVGTSIGVSIVPPSGNTNMNFGLTLMCYYIDPNNL